MTEIAGSAAATPTEAIPDGLELKTDERVILTVIQSPIAIALGYVFTLGLLELFRRRRYLTLTSQRVWVAHGRFIWKAQRSLPLAKVQDATFNKGPISGRVLITTAGGTAGNITFRGLWPADARRFVEDLNGLLAHNASSNGPSIGTLHNPADALRDLAKLRDEGHLTDAEYTAKKQEILARM